MKKYAIIFSDRITDEHIQLIRITGVNTYFDSLIKTRPDYSPEMRIIEWEHNIAEQIPEAVQAIDQMISEGVIIRNEAEMRDYLADETNPFYVDPP